MLHSQIIDDFLPCFDQWRAMADEAEFAGLVSPVDGVTYPGICPLPEFYPAVGELLRKAMGRDCAINHLFMRLSLHGSSPPHWAHHDANMGNYSLMVYLNRPEHCQGGTALLEHYTGADPDEEMWLADTNNQQRWHIASKCPMATNRAFIFRSGLWHAALPAGGFGQSSIDGRLVLTAFFK